jgi:hypothetical protein
MDNPRDSLRKRVICSFCGAMDRRRHGLVPLSWHEITAFGRAIAMCPDCVRRNLWQIEARLDVDPE